MLLVGINMDGYKDIEFPFDVDEPTIEIEGVFFFKWYSTILKMV